MRILRKKRRAAIILLLPILVGVWLLAERDGTAIHKTSFGWTYSGPIDFGDYELDIAPRIVGENLVFVERFRRRRFYRRGLRIERVVQGSPKDLYWLASFHLDDGDRVFRCEMTVEGYPLQVKAIWRWHDNVVAWGCYQKEGPQEGNTYVAVIVNAQGKIAGKLEDPILSLKPMAVDEENDLLLCIQTYERDGSRRAINPYLVRAISLTSGMEKFKMPAEGVFDIVTDGHGAAYLMRRPGSADGEEPVFDAIVEKYRTVPWERIWSVTIHGSKSEYPISLRYDADLLWCAVYDADGGRSVWDKVRWNGYPLDAETGTSVVTDRKCDPYRIEASLGGKCYIVVKQGGDLAVHVTRSSQ